MIAKGKVNIRWQIILLLLPITAFSLGGFYAAFRIRKLRKFVALWLIVNVVFWTFDYFYLVEFIDPNPGWLTWLLIPGYYYFVQNDAGTLLTMIVENIVYFITLIFFINRWSKQWNTDFNFIG